MLVCGHEREPHGEALCTHLRTCREPPIDYVRWLTGSGIDVELLCTACVGDWRKGHPVETHRVCEECYDFATDEVGSFEGTRGTPGFPVRPEPFSTALREETLPEDASAILDVAPVDMDRQPVWLLLTESGEIIRWHAGDGDFARVGSVKIRREPKHKPFQDHALKHRLYVSADGRFAAVVNDYGRYGQVADLESGRRTLALNGGGYHPETVPLSFAFAEVAGRTVAVHRTAWNRLDVSDPATGKLLTCRRQLRISLKLKIPKHYLDYFHGALYVSPSGRRILDDGWVWHPLGMPASWNLERWLTENVWESEDGPSRKFLCARDYYWDRAFAWIDDERVAVEGIGDDDAEMIPGARLFDVTQPGTGEDWLRSDLPMARELAVLAGPKGRFFSDGTWLFSADETGLSRWALDDGARTGHLEGFRPTHHHRGAGELVQLSDGVLLRWSLRACRRLEVP